MCQLIHREELNHISRWVVDSRLEKLKFARLKQTYCYFSAAVTIFPPQLSDDRIAWAKNGVLTTVVDDLYDVGGSEEELVNLVQLIEKWDVNAKSDTSEQVEIIFSAIKSTVDEIEANALQRQERSVANHVIEIWLDLVKSMMKEAQWSMNKSAPALDGYMENAYVLFALGPVVLPALYLVGHKLKLTEEVVQSFELHQVHQLFKLRVSAQGKLNAVTLTMLHGNGRATEEEILNEIKSIVTCKRIELQRLVLQEKDSLVPRACKDLFFWNMSKIVHLFYAKHDGYTGQDMMKTVSAVIEEPINLSELQLASK